jgi:hypothetical protein
MEASSDVWKEIFFYITSARDLATIWMTGDRKIRGHLGGARTFSIEISGQSQRQNIHQIILMSSRFTGLKRILIINSPTSIFRLEKSKPEILEPSLLSRLPVGLEELEIDSTRISLCVNSLSLLPHGLQKLRACLAQASLDISDISWPSLTEYTVKGCYWEMPITSTIVSSFPQSLTKLDLGVGHISWDSETLELEKELDLSLGHSPISPFSQLTNVLWCRFAPEERSPVFFPPNVTHLVLEMTSRPHWFWDKIPRSVQTLITMSPRKMTPSHPTCFEKDFAGLPQGLTTLHTHEITNMKNVQVLKEGIPPWLTSLNIKRLPISSIEALPSTLTYLEAFLQKEENLTYKPIHVSLPNLRVAGIFNNPFYDVPENVYLSLPVAQLVDINFGPQISIPAAFWERLNPNLRSLKSANSIPSFSEQHLVSLPPNLKTLEICISNFILEDRHVPLLPRGLTTLKLLGTDKLTDACVAELPRSLRMLKLSDNYSFTSASIPDWPPNLTHLSIGANSDLNKLGLESRFSHRITIQLLFRTQ